uniref:Methyltransferase domain-containing protein n=1 Tax=Caenorhabditis tropicalis TaxID=1561998 RepID=A0A1I7TDJ2_9PELO
MLPVERRGLYEDQFAAALHGWIALNHDNASKAVCLYPQIKQLFPLTIRTRMSLVRAVQNTDKGKWILNCLPICREAMEIATKEEDLVALRIARVNLTTLPFPQWHIRMINDVKRNEAFAKALNTTIKSRSSVVFDIGSGTGILSVIAAKNTNLVVALEENVCLAMISKQVLKRNGVEGRVTVHAKNSTAFETNQKADVIVSETLDCCVFGEKIVETFLDAHVRFAHEKTVFIPNQATVLVRLFRCREIFDIHCQDYGGVRYRSEYVKINDSPAEQPYWCATAADFAEFEFLSAPEEIYSVNFTNLADLQESLNSGGALKLSPIKEGVAHGFAIHFTSDLTGNGIVIDSSECRAWDLGIIPFKEPCVVKCGQELDISWKLEYDRLDVYNNFYAESLQRAEDSLRYESVLLEQIQKIRDDSFFKPMMNEISQHELPFTLDISSNIPAQCVVNTVDRETPTKILITSLYRHDGALDQETFFRIEEFTGYRDFIEKIVPSRVRIIGRLFTSDRSHFDARPDPSAHCQVDLADVRSFNIRELRDIRLTQRKDIQMTSDEFTVYEFNLTAENFRQDAFTTVNRVIEVQPNRPGSDGVIYEFEVLGIRNHKLRPVAAFLFPDRINNDNKVCFFWK